MVKQKNRLIKCLLFWVFMFVFDANIAEAQTGGEQNKIITFSGTHITLGKAMIDIQKQTSYKFAFIPAQLQTGTPVKLTSQNLTLRAALEQMFGNGNYKYVIRNRFIAVSVDNTVASRANVVAKARDDKPLTSDVFRPNNPDSLSAESLKMGDPEGEYEIERIVTLVPGDTVVRNYPRSHSAYEPIEKFRDTETVLPRFALKTNLAYAGALQTPNLSAEIGLSPKSTLELSGSYSWQGRKEAFSETETHKQFAHWIIRPEYRYWTCERYNGHYFGVHGLYSRYFVSGKNIPMLFDKEFSYDGHAVGAGLTYGYHWAIGKRWGLEFNVGLGYAYMWYDKGTCSKCMPLPKRETKHYVGPTRAGINLVFMIK